MGKKLETNYEFSTNLSVLVLLRSDSRSEIRMNILAPPKSYLSVLSPHYTFMLQTRLKRGYVCSKYGCQGFLYRPITLLRSIKTRLVRD